MKYIICYVLLLLIHGTYASCYTLSEQGGSVTGKVIDVETGKRLEGVNVIIEGTTIGAATDMSGEIRDKKNTSG